MHHSTLEYVHHTLMCILYRSLGKICLSNFHVKKFCVEIFSPSWILDEKFLTANNYLVEVLPLVLCLV